MHRFEEDPVVPALGAPPGAAGPEDLQHRRPILICHPRQHGRLLPNRPAKCHRSTNVGIHSLHTQPNPSTRPRPSACTYTSCAGTGISLSSPWEAAPGPHREGRRPSPMMNGAKKSDSLIVPAKPANKAGHPAAELVEGSSGTKRNAKLQSTVRTQSRGAVSQAQDRIRGAVTRGKEEKLTALLHHITVDVLRQAFFNLKKRAAPGV